MREPSVDAKTPQKGKFSAMITSFFTKSSRKIVVEPDPIDDAEVFYPQTTNTEKTFENAIKLQKEFLKQQETVRLRKKLIVR